MSSVEKMPQPDRYPPFVAAAVQTAPVFLNTPATIDKVCSLIREAARNGASLAAFPEVLVPGYPYWNWLTNPLEGAPWFQRLQAGAVEVPGPEIDRLRHAARENRCGVVIGVNEKVPHSVGTLYNTLVFIDADGTLLGRHRKLVPTWAEKLTWGQGDGSSLRAYASKAGPLGGLACGENTNPLARFSLLAQGELIHVSSYIALPVAPPDYDMAEAIRLRSMNQSFEGKNFTIVATSTISQEIIEAMAPLAPDARSRMGRRSSAFSGIVGPDGRVIGEPLIDEEGIVYAEIDLSRCVQPKLMHDIVGHYNRFDIFQLTVNRRQLDPVSFPNASKSAPVAELQHGDDTDQLSRPEVFK
jgi:aliphatic nitrilase